MRRLLLDTHVVLWALAAPERLGVRTAELLRDPNNEVRVSAVSVWEVAIKRALGKLAAPDGFTAECRSRDFDELPISFEHAELAGSLPPHHADPFDRMLVAQAQVEGLELVTLDRALASYDVRVVMASV